MTIQRQSQDGKIRAIFFDFMGTCLNWLQSVTSAFPEQLSEATKSSLGMEWRQAYFDEKSLQLNAGSEVEEFDIILLRALNQVLAQKPADIQKHFNTEEQKRKAVAAFHNQKAWDEVPDAIRKLKNRGINHSDGWEIFVHGDGTTRLQLDLIRSSGLHYFDMLFSTSIAGAYKPSPESYARVLELIQRRPEECVLVAAHAYDLRGAKKAGMKTVYIRRWTDDVNEYQEKLKTEFDAYLDDMTELDVTIARLSST